MRSLRYPASILSAAAAVMITAQARAAGFLSPSDLLVSQANGDGNPNGTLATSADSVSIFEFNPATISTGVPVNTVNLPVGTLSYNGSSGLSLTLPDAIDHTGQLTLSQDGHQLVMGTYLSGIGALYSPSAPTTAVGPNNLPASQVPRVITVIHPNGTVDDSTQLTGVDDYNSVSIRQVSSLDGTQFWSTGNGAKPYGGDGVPDLGGLRYSTLGASTSSSLNIGDGIDCRTTQIFGGQLYVAGGSSNNPTGEHTTSQLGTGLPNSIAPTWTPLRAVGAYTNGTIFGNQSPQFLTLSNGVQILYQSDSTGDTLDKYTMIQGVWTLQNKMSVPSIENVAAAVSGTTVNIYVSTALYVYQIADTGGAGKISNTTLPVPVLSAQGYAYFNGISFAPSSSPAVGNQIWGSLAGTGSTGGSWTAAANWADGIPNAPGATATFGPGLTANGTVSLNGNQTVGHVLFNDAAASYNVASGSGGSLTINNNSPDGDATGVASIFNTAGSHSISAPIILANGVTVADQYQQALTLAGPISGAGGMQIYGPGSLTLSAANTYSGDTTVHSGAAAVTASGSFPTTTNLTVGDTADNAATGLNASVTIAASVAAGIRPVTLASLNVQSNGSVSLLSPTNHPNRSVLVLGGLTFAGTTSAWTGALDLAANDMIVHNGSLAIITDQIREGFNLAGGGRWNGSGGVTSTAAAADSTHLTALGVISNFSGLYSTFDGQPVSTSDILVKYTYFGDANLDGRVDGSDYTLIDNGFNRGLHGWINGDFNYDGIVDGSDYTLIDNAFNTLGTQGGSPLGLVAATTDQIAGNASVPEPASVTVVALAAISLVFRRTRSSSQF